MNYDIIIYAVIAIAILARLWSVLGQHGGEDRERPNPFAPPPPPAAPPALAGPSPDTPRLAAPLLAPDSLAGGLAHIKQADPAFDEKHFLQDARAAFTLILKDYVKGDLTESAPRLGPNVRPRFQAAIEARRAAGQVMEHKLIALREAECVSAKLEGDTARITVRFVTEQQSTLRDAQGQAVGGEGHSEEIIDLWVFARDVKSPGSNWILVETKS